MNKLLKTNDYQKLLNKIRAFGRELGFQEIGIADIELEQAESRLKDWLGKGFHGAMDYMKRHGVKRSRPEELVPGTMRVICARMDYLPPAKDASAMLENHDKAYIARYALGRDYHKLIRKRLEMLARKIKKEVGSLHYRVFTDSAPVMEKPLAEKAGLGWIGKSTNLIHHQEGTWFFIGTIYIDCPLPIDTPSKDHCGSCRKCIDVCPTQAIVAPYQLNASRCISYLTIELRKSIPEDLRPLIGNRVYGCDDCQIVCPWNKFAKHTKEDAFYPRHDLDQSELLKLFAWSEEEFLKKTEGSAIRRIGYSCWLRNLAVALGNAHSSPAIIEALKDRLSHPSPLVREHVAWALKRQTSD